MVRYREDKLVKCPYYKSDSDFGMVCEGPVEGSSLTIKFKDGNIKTSYKGGFCRRRWEECPVAVIAAEKYK